jgi:hypothetical protein
MSKVLSREQLEDAAKCRLGSKEMYPCRGCKMVYIGEHQQFDECIIECAKTALYWQGRCEQLENDKINAEMNLEHLTGIVERQAAVLKQAREALIDAKHTLPDHIYSITPYKKIMAAIAKIDELESEGK